MKTLHAEFFIGCKELVKFVNENGIKREDILTVTGGDSDWLTLLYYA